MIKNSSFKSLTTLLMLFGVKCSGASLQEDYFYSGVFDAAHFFLEDSKENYLNLVYHQEFQSYDRCISVSLFARL